MRRRRTSSFFPRRARINEGTTLRTRARELARECREATSDTSEGDNHHLTVGADPLNKRSSVMSVPPSRMAQIW